MPLGPNGCIVYSIYIYVSIFLNIIFVLYYEYIYICTRSEGLLHDAWEDGKCLQARAKNKGNLQMKP